jgi:hypothetical protein
MPAISATRRLRQESCKFKSNLNYTVRPCLRKKLCLEINTVLRDQWEGVRDGERECTGGEEEDNEHNDTRQKLLGKGNGGGGVKRI